MALNFPASPESGDTYTSGTTTWQFDGISWSIVSSLTSALSIPNSFDTISVDGQDDVVAGSVSDTLTLVAGSNVTIVTDSASDTITFSSTGGGGGASGESNQNAFSNIAVSGQNTIAADTTTDTLNLAGGAGITITTNSTTDTIQIANSTTPVSSFHDLTDASNALLEIHDIYEHAITTFRVDNDGAIAYTFNSHYTGNNPTIYVLSGTTVAFDLDNISGHPFEIQDNTLTALTSNLVHVSSDGTVSTDAAAQGKSSGTLYWRIPENTTNNTNYVYQCQVHAAMFGSITIKRLANI